MPTKTRCSEYPVHHIFICHGWHILNDMYPFFQALKPRGALLFTNVTHEGYSAQVRPLHELHRFSFESKHAIVYLSTARHYGSYVQKSALASCKLKTVKLFHGVAGSWARFLLMPRDFIDLVITASDLDTAVYREMTRYRVETIGWPRAETFMRDAFSPKTEPRSIVISSSWSKDKADFRICDRVHELTGYHATLMLHPVLRTQTFRDVDNLCPRWVKQQLRKLHGKADVVECKHGVFPHMLGKEVMLSAISSTAFEWLLFQKPAFFLRRHSALDFGRDIDFERPLLPQIESAEPPRFYEARAALRAKLTSHFDGKWADRFAGLNNELERTLLS